MTTQRTDEKNPAQGGVGGQAEARAPMLPSSARCIWAGPQTSQEQWDLKEKMERLLDRLNKALWVCDTQHADDVQRRTEAVRRDVLMAMDQALTVEALLFERCPEDQMRQSATWHFDSLKK